MNTTAAKQKIALEVKSAKQRTKHYLQYLEEAITNGDWADAEYLTSQLAPIWGAIENSITEMRNEEEGVA